MGAAAINDPQFNDQFFAGAFFFVLKTRWSGTKKAFAITISRFLCSLFGDHDYSLFDDRFFGGIVSPALKTAWSGTKALATTINFFRSSPSSASSR